MQLDNCVTIEPNPNDKKSLAVGAIAKTTVFAIATIVTQNAHPLHITTFHFIAISIAASKQNWISKDITPMS